MIHIKTDSDRLGPTETDSDRLGHVRTCPDMSGHFSDLTRPTAGPTAGPTAAMCKTAGLGSSLNVRLFNIPESYSRSLLSRITGPLRRPLCTITCFERHVPRDRLVYRSLSGDKKPTFFYISHASKPMRNMSEIVQVKGLIDILGVTIKVKKYR